MDFSGVVNVGHTVFAQAATHIDKDTSVQTSINVVKVQQEKFANFGFNEHVIPTLIVNIKVSEVAEIIKDDQIKIGSVTYNVIGDPEKDSQQLIWVVRLST